MISFLNSGILFLSAAILIPVMIFLFAKKKPNKLIFSSIKFIKESQQKQKRKINLKNLLLLIIRILIILFTILAIARPAIKSELLEKGDEHPKTGIAIIIDDSYSMNYLVDTKTELEKAKQIVHQINEMIGDDDNTILITLNDNWNKLHARIGFGKIADKLIEQVTISAQTIPLEDVLKLAENKLKQTHLPNNEVYLVTDMQKRKMPESLEFPTFFIPTSAGKDRSNISCENAAIKHEIVSNTKKKQIEFELVNHSGSAQNDVVYELFIDGNTVSQKAADLLPKQSKKLNFPIEVQTPGWHSGYTSVKNERLRFDNRSYFSFYNDLNPKVAIITDLTDLPATLGSMLEIYSGNVTIINDENINLQQLQKYENVIIYKKRELSGKMRSILKRWKENKQRIIFIADEDMSETQQNFAAKFFNCEFQQFSTKSENINTINKFHSITKLMKDMNSIEIRDLWQVTSNANILLSTNNTNVAIEHENSVLWLFDIQSIANTFLLNPLFPLFAYNCLKFTGEHESKFYKIGNKISLESNHLTLPDAEEITLKNNYFFPAEAGNYLSDNKVITVNLDYSESEYERLTKYKLNNLHLLADNWQDNILQSRYGFELWKYLLIAALLLFIVEMLIIKSEEKSKIKS